MRLAGQHAIVTGGGTGIGAAIAAALEMEGAVVSRIGRRPVKLGASGFAADVTDRAQVDAAFSAARAARGPIAILVNNAGAAQSAPFAKLTVDGWRQMMAVNLDGVFHCCQAALSDLLQAINGRIVTVASTAALRGYPYTAAYGAAKHGAVGLTRALAAEFARTNLTVNAVCPGFTDTNLVIEAVARLCEKTGRSEEEARAEVVRFNPQGRLVTPEEVAAAVLWLSLPESQAMNGQAIALAGGELM
jgi:NAD(P)-dependent dehydrogenase (short-subunit alcohol dehydrogenase family)